MHDILIEIFNDSELDEKLDKYLDVLLSRYKSLKKEELVEIVFELKPVSKTAELFKSSFEKRYNYLIYLKNIDTEILKVLNRDDYDARTISGLSKAINKTEKEVIQRIMYSKELNDLLKIFPRKSRDGQVLITTKAKYEKSASFTDKFIDAFATSRVRLD